MGLASEYPVARDHALKRLTRFRYRSSRRARAAVHKEAANSLTQAPGSYEAKLHEGWARRQDHPEDAPVFLTRQHDDRLGNSSSEASGL